MRDYKHLTRFPGSDRQVLEAAVKQTGLSANQLIVRCVHDALPKIVAEHERLDLSPLPDEALARVLKQMSREELAEAAALGRASSRPKPGDLP